MQKYWDEQVFTVVSDEEDCDTKHQLEYYQAQCRFHLGMEQTGGWWWVLGEIKIKAKLSPAKAGVWAELGNNRLGFRFS